MKIAFLEYKVDGLRSLGFVFLAFGAALLVVGGFPLLNEQRDPNFAGAVITAIAGVAVVLVGLVFLWGSPSWRAGRRFCSGVMWDTAKSAGSYGKFVLKIDPRSRQDSSPLAQRHAVLEIAPSTKTPPTEIYGCKPELLIRLGREHNDLSYGISYVAFAGFAVSRATSWIRVLQDGQISSFKLIQGSVGQLLAGFRELGKSLASLGPESFPVRICVELPQLPPAKQGGLAGLASNPAPGMVGGLAAAVMGVAPALGVVAGALASDSLKSSSKQVESVGQKQVRAIIFGAADRPSSESLKSVADEFGWTIEGPGGFRRVGAGNAPPKQA